MRVQVREALNEIIKGVKRAWLRCCRIARYIAEVVAPVIITGSPHEAVDKEKLAQGGVGGRERLGREGTYVVVFI